MKRDYDAVKALKREANVAKERLMRIEQELRSAGAVREANGISAIIVRIEVWQNR